MVPERFKEMMTPVLGADFGIFIDALENSPAVRALRVNTLKISPDNFLKLCPMELKKIPYLSASYIFDTEKVGAMPLHHGGAFYVQDPSAQCAVEAVADYIPRNAVMLDMCAAPGGKTAQLTGIAPDGFLVSNEIVFSRAKILRGNLERMGAKRCAVTSAAPALIAKQYPETFDAVLCDAPCSGEGMMRKYNAEVMENWSEENVHSCAGRQAEILDCAAKCVKSGGILIYSTCTFNLFENEMTVDSFLKSHGEFSIIPANEKIAGITSPGINFDGCVHDMTYCRRFYPHLSEGEGQFICIMKKEGEEFSCKEKANLKPLSKEEKKIAEAFFDSVMGGIPAGYSAGMLKDTVMLYPENALCPENALFCGVAAGEIIKGRFQPHHHLFSAFGRDFKRKTYLPPDSADASRKAEKYLRGETVTADCENGWCAVFYGYDDICGCAVGGGKTVDGVVKNHYPKGLRNIK